MTGTLTPLHEIYQRHAADVFRYALFLCGNRAQAEDITSETFVRLWTAPGEIRVTTVKAYLFTIARHLWPSRSTAAASRSCWYGTSQGRDCSGWALAGFGSTTCARRGGCA